MRKIFIPNIRSGLMIMVLLCLLPSLWIIWHDGVEDRQQAAEVAKTQAMQIAQQAVHNQQSLIETGNRLLGVLASMSAVRSRDAAACNALFAEVLPEDYFFASLNVSTPDGNVFCSTTGLSTPVNLADRPYFQEVLRERKAVISDYMIGRLTGRSIIVLGAPVFDEQGEVAAVLSTGLDLNWMNDLIADTSLPAGSTIEVIDSRGVILNIFPSPSDWIGKSLPDDPYFNTILAMNGKGSLELDGLDGIKRLYAFTPMYSGEKITGYVIVGIPSRIAFAAAERAGRENIYFLSAATLLALLAAYFAGDALVMRNILQLMRATSRLAAGEGQVRTGVRSVIREFRQLGAAFDQMAAQIDRQRAEISLAEAKYRTLVEQMPAVTYLVSLAEPVKILYLSPQLEKMVGGPVDAWYEDADLWLAQVHPDDRRRMDETKVINRQNARMTEEYRFIHADGSVHWVSDVSAIINDDQGQPTLLQGMVTDITQRKQAEHELQSAYGRLKFFVDSNMIGVTIGNPEGQILEANDYFLTLVDMTRADLEAGRVNWQDLTPPEHLPADARATLEMQKHGVSMPFEKEYYRKNGSRTWVSIAIAFLPSENMTVCYVLDITARKQTEVVLARRMKELACLQAVSAACVAAKTEDNLLDSVTTIIGDNLFSSHFGVLMCDEAAGELYVPPSYRLNGLSRNVRIPLGVGVTGKAALDGQPRRISDTSREPAFIHSTPNMRSELCAPIMIGSRVIGVINAESDRLDAFSEGDERMMMALADQLALGLERLHFVTNLEALATIDALSGVMNRRCFMEHAEAEFNRAQRMNLPISAIMLDVDWFKEINDTYGHPAGDQVLHEIANRFREKIRDIDLIGRLGGDEFAILLTKTGLERALAVAERIRSEIESCPFTIGESQMKISISLGVAQIIHTPDQSIHHLMSAADQALYDAKHHGRNQVAARLVNEA